MKVPFIPKTIGNPLHHLYLIVGFLYFPGRYRAVLPRKNSGSVRHDRDGHFHQLWHFALLRLFHPIKHDIFGCLFIGLHPYLSELLFEVVGLRERFSSFRRSSLQASDEPQKRKKSHKRVSVLFLCGVKLLQDSKNSKL